jgi:hypothetical protein
MLNQIIDVLLILAVITIILLYVRLKKLTKEKTMLEKDLKEVRKRIE